MKTYREYLKEKININEIIPDILVKYYCAVSDGVCVRGHSFVIDHAVNVFGHKDKHLIVFLKFMRFYMLLNILNNIKQYPEDYGNSISEVKEFIDKYYDKWHVEIDRTQREVPKDTETINSYLLRIIGSFDYYYDLNLPNIESFAPPPNMSMHSLLDTFNEFEKAKDLIPDSLRTTQDWKTIVKFSNGWEWVDIGQSYCRFEAKSMEHCGNSPNAKDTNQTIFSLREPELGGKYWKPHLTFIYWKREKSLGEMKGKGNDKPHKSYHDYIIKLLEHPLIQAIHGGGWQPDNNFSIPDLDYGKMDKLLRAKPQLADIGMQLYLGKVTDTNQAILQKSNLKFSNGSLDSIPIKLKDILRYISVTDRETEEIIESFAYGNLDGIIDPLDTFGEYFNPSLASGELNKYKSKIYTYIKQTYDKDISDFDNFGAALHFISEEGDELWDKLNQTYHDASRIGVETSAREYMMNFITDNVILKSEENRYGYIIGEGNYNDGTGAFTFEFDVVDNEDIIDLLGTSSNYGLFIDEAINLRGIDYDEFDRYYWESELDEIFTQI